MPFISLFCEAAASLSMNKLRSGLAVLGMLIGVASVIVMLAIGQGSQRAIKQTIANLGSDLLIIKPVDESRFDTSTLTERDASALMELPILRTAATVLHTNEPTWVSYNDNLLRLSVVGVTPSYFAAREWAVSHGTLFNEDDVSHRSMVAVLGSSAAARLFKKINPVGRYIAVKGFRLQIVGVLRSKGQTIDGSDQDEVVLVPQGFVRQHLMDDGKSRIVHLIYAKFQTGVPQRLAEVYIRRALRSSHSINKGDLDDFTISDIKSVAESELKASSIMSMLLGTISSVSLVVGGIGIMNIMLVSVTERTREIGIRKAVGGASRDIWFQFLCEAMLMALAGCVAGICCGVGLTTAVSLRFDIPTDLNAWPIIVSFAVAIVTGVFFGLYPAIQASRLLPVDALKR